MRILTFIGLGLLLLQGVAAECECLERAANAVNCDIDDPECFCDSDKYIDVLNTCARRSINDCTDDELSDARSSFVRVCLREESTSTPSATSTTSESQSRTTTSSTTRTATNSPTSAATSSGPALTTAQIGGIAGGASGLVLLLIAAVIFRTYRKYQKQDKKEEVARADDAERFIEGGRQFRAASMTVNPNDRLYSTQRPLSYALGEYNSAHYDGEDDDRHGRNIGMQQTGAAGSYFNQFSGNYVEDSSKAFDNNNRYSRGFAAAAAGYRNSQRSASAPFPGHTVPTASLSYEEYRNHAFESTGERTSLMMEEQPSGSMPHRSVSAPLSPGINRNPIGNSVSERSRHRAPHPHPQPRSQHQQQQQYYQPQSQPQYHAGSSAEAQRSSTEYGNRRYSFQDYRYR